MAEKKGSAGTEAMADEGTEIMKAKDNTPLIPSQEGNETKGFELNPTLVVIHIPMERAGVISYLAHHFSGYPTKEDIHNINRESVKQRVKGEEIEMFGDSDKPKAMAWDKLIIEVGGYKGCEEFSKEDLQKAIPLHHKVMAINHMTEVYRQVKDDDLVEAEFDLERNIDMNIILVIKRGELVFPVEHLMNEFGPYEIGEIGKLILKTGAMGNGIEIAGSSKKLKQIDQFYDNKVISVKGYLWKDKPLMDQANWKALIPLNQKALAIAEAQERMLGVEKN